MSEIKNMENELEPRLQQMLKAYGATPKRDPKAARRNQERFVAILNMIFEEPASSNSATGWLALPLWVSSFKTFRERFATSFRTRAIMVFLRCAESGRPSQDCQHFIR